MGVLSELAGYLASQGLGQLGVSVFYGDLPADPDACLAVLSNPGLPPMRTHDDWNAIEQPRIQVQVRGNVNDFKTPEDLAHQVYVALCGIVNLDLAGTNYKQVLPSNPFTVGRDDMNRWLIAVNAEVLKNPS